MRVFLIGVLAIAMAGCVLESDPAKPSVHEVEACGAGWQNELPPFVPETCERACVTPIAMNGPSCNSAGVDQNGNPITVMCPQTGTFEGHTGCCLPLPNHDPEVIFRECE